MSRKYDAFVGTVDVTASGQLDLDVRDAELLRLVAKVATLAGGAAPTVDFQLLVVMSDGSDGPELTNMGGTVNTVGALSDAGVVNVPSDTVRLKWVTAGGPTGATVLLNAWGVR